MKLCYVCFFLFALGLALITRIYLKVEILIELLPDEGTDNDRNKIILIQLNPLFRPFRRKLRHQFESQLDLSLEGICQKADLFITKLQQYNRVGYSSQIGILDVIMSGGRKLRLEKLDWETYIGLGDAMDTAICSGGLWAIKGNIIAFISARKRLELMKIKVQPDFSGKRLTSRLYCIVKMRLVHIIFIVVRKLLLKKMGDNTMSRGSQSPAKKIDKVPRYA